MFGQIQASQTGGQLYNDIFPVIYDTVSYGKKSFAALVLGASSRWASSNVPIWTSVSSRVRPDYLEQQRFHCQRRLECPYISKPTCPCQCHTAGASCKLPKSASASLCDNSVDCSAYKLCQPTTCHRPPVAQLPATACAVHNPVSWCPCSTPARCIQSANLYSTYNYKSECFSPESSKVNKDVSSLSN